MLRGSGSYVAVFTTHRLLQGKPGGNIIVFGIVIGVIVGIGIVVMTGVLIYVYTCKPENISRHNSVVNDEKATTCRDSGHVLSPTTALRLAEELEGHAGSRYRQLWVCDFCNKNFRAIDEQTIYHCNHSSCGLDLCRSCYGDLHCHRSSFINATNSDPVVAVPFHEDAPANHHHHHSHVHNKKSSAKHSDGKVHPTGASASSASDVEDIEAGAAHHEKRRRGSRADNSEGASFPTQFATHADGAEKNRRNSGSSVHSNDQEIGGYNPKYAEVYLGGVDTEPQEQHGAHYPKRRGSKDCQVDDEAASIFGRRGSKDWSAANDGKKKRSSSAASHVSEAHAASYAAVYGDD